MKDWHEAAHEFIECDKGGVTKLMVNTSRRHFCVRGCMCHGPNVATIDTRHRMIGACRLSKLIMLETWKWELKCNGLVKV